jgi:hypothetical protein
MTAAAQRKAWLGLALCAALALPPLRHTLEATMTLQMLAQLPLLGVAGWWLAAFFTPRMSNALARWNHGGISGLLLASLASLVWMLPRALDAVLETPWVEGAKFISVPLLIGLPLALSWPRAGFVVRGVFLLEAIATAFRLGWLYLASPQRLCSNYLLGDQQRLGELLMAIGAAILLFVMWKIVCGHPRIDAEHAHRN